MFALKDLASENLETIYKKMSTILRNNSINNDDDNDYDDDDDDDDDDKRNVRSFSRISDGK